MKKIPTLFRREFDGQHVVSITGDVVPGMEWVLSGEGVATEKTDGACCAIIDGKFYRRYDAKKNKKGIMKTPPEGAIPCDEPDPVTGHWPHWLEVRDDDPGAKWFLEALKNARESGMEIAEWTYEAVGPHFQSNPYGVEADTLVRHGSIVIDLPDRSFEGIRSYLETHILKESCSGRMGSHSARLRERTSASSGR